MIADRLKSDDDPERPRIDSQVNRLGELAQPVGHMHSLLGADIWQGHKELFPADAPEELG